MRLRPTWLLICAAVAGLLSSMAAAPAHSSELRWVNPTANCNGSTLTNQVATRIYRATDKASLPASVPPGESCTATAVDYTAFASKLIATVPYPGTSYVDPGTDGKLYYYVVTAVNADGVESNPAGPVVNTRPLAPSGVSIALVTGPGDSPAYMVVRGDNTFIALPVGTAPGGTTCDANNAALAQGRVYYAVPRNSVVFYGSTQPKIVVAACS